MPGLPPEPSTVDEEDRDLAEEVLQTLERSDAEATEEIRIHPLRRKTFHEPVHQCISQKWVDRYLGARDALLELDALRTSAGSMLATRSPPSAASATGSPHGSYAESPS